MKNENDQHFREVDVSGAAALAHAERVEVLPQREPNCQHDQADNADEHREHGRGFERRVPRLFVVHGHLLEQIDAQHEDRERRGDSADMPRRRPPVLAELRTEFTCENTGCRERDEQPRIPLEPRCDA